MNIFIEKIRFYHYPVIKFYLSRCCHIYVFDFNCNARQIGWFKNLADKSQISLISPVIIGSDNLAMDNIEKVYPFIAGESRLINTMVQLYNDRDISLAYKKTLARELTHFYAVGIILEKNQKALPTKEKVVFIPYGYLEMMQALSLCGIFHYKLDNVFIPSWLKYIAYIDKYFNRLASGIKLLFFNFSLLIIALLKVLMSLHKRGLRSYEFAIPITYPDLQFKFQQKRNFDFLLDEKGIRKDNVVFLVLSAVKQSILRKVKKEGYNIINCRTTNVLFSFEFSLGKAGLRILKKLIKYITRSFIFAFFENNWVISCSNVLLYNYLKWSIILNSIKFRHYIAFQDEGEHHIGRNSLLQYFGCKSWLYDHTASHAYTQPRGNAWYEGFMLYDYYISWNKATIENRRFLHQKIKKYFNIGCIWSEFIANGSPTENISYYLERKGVKNKEIKNNFKVISFFDATYCDAIYSMNLLKDGIKFYKDILRLLYEDPNLFAIIKEKKPEKFYSAKGSFLYSSFHEEYSFVLKRLKDYPRCYAAGYDADPAGIIKISDLTVTCAFSSPTIEALGARKKAIFYDPNDKFRGLYYDLIPGLVVHGYDELHPLIDKLLYSTSHEEYEIYLNRQILHRIEDYLDGRALSRFRELLVKS